MFNENKNLKSMKKRVFSMMSMTAFIGLVTMTSCTKEDDKVTTTTQSNGNARVVFSSIEEYEKLFEEPSKSDSLAGVAGARFGIYNEYARLLENPEDILYPEFLLKILNDDRIVQIENWIVKVDMITERCLVLEKKYAHEYNDLVNDNLSNPHVMIFDIADNVLPMLREGYTGSNIEENTRISGLFCKGVSSYEKESDLLYFTGDYEPVAPITGSTSYYLLPINTYTKIWYQKAGVYFALKSSAYTTIPITSDAFGQQKPIKSKKIGIGWDGQWRINCGDLVTRGEVNFNPYEEAWVEKTHYSGIKSLNHASLSVRSVYQRKDGSYFESPIQSYIGSK
jgi:hypothetical protein